MKNNQRTSRVRKFGGWLVLAVTVFTGWAPTAALAESPIAQVTLYEVTEALRFKPPHAVQQAGVLHRLAQASLLGTEITDAAAGTPFANGNYVTADASSNVDLSTLKGPVNGTIKILLDTDPNRLSLDTLVVTSALRIHGELDLTTAQEGFAAVTGRWHLLRDQRTRGTFAGLFLIPFQMALPGFPVDQYWYVDPATINEDLGLKRCDSPFFGLCPLSNKEFALGIPLTKAVVIFYSR